MPPEITRIDLWLDLEPSERRMSVAGSYALVNDTPAADTAWLPFTVGSSFGPVVWSLAGAALAVESRSGLDIVTLPQPLPPGAGLRLDFAYDATYPRGFTRNCRSGAGTFILPAGVLLSTHRGEFLPVAGFVEHAERGDKAEPARPQPARYPDGSVPAPASSRSRRPQPPS